MKLTIIGASGHGRVVADIACLCGYDGIEFLDDDENLKNCGPYPVAGPSSLAQEQDQDLFVAIGDAAVRRRMLERFSEKRIPVLIHPGAIVAKGAKIGRGSVVMAGAVVNPGAVIGRGCIINTGSSVDHDCLLGDYVHVAVGAHLCGSVTAGDEVWIGAGAVVSNNIRLCGGCRIGAGAVVVQDILESGTYIGVPARKKTVAASLRTPTAKTCGEFGGGIAHPE